MHSSGSRISGSSTPPSTRRYESYYTTPYTSSSVRDYNTSYSSYTGGSSHYSSYQSRRPFTSRFLKTRFTDYDNDDDDQQTTTTSKPTKCEASSDHDIETRSDANATNNSDTPATRPSRKAHNRPVVLNGTVIRIRRELSTSEEESSEEEEEEEDPEEEKEEEQPEEEVVEPEPEDPLDVEERQLNNQLMLSLTLTLVDEENIRQRLLEIRKTKLRRNQATVENSLVQRFQTDADVTLFENQTSPAREEEERILRLRLTASELTEVEQKDIQVRLQEIFRDRRVVLEDCLKNIEGTYEHILQETSTEMTELETSIRNKGELVEKLQEEILNMTVRKELLSTAMEKVNLSHQSKVEGLTRAMSEIDEKMSNYAVVVSSSNSKSNSSKLLSNNIPNASEELRELERELECPVCMDIARPPIYQCEEGHIICAHCKPLLTNCPHNCGKKYSEPAIRCRFAEKLADKYSAQLAKHVKNDS